MKNEKLNMRKKSQDLHYMTYHTITIIVFSFLGLSLILFDFDRIFDQNHNTLLSVLANDSISSFSWSDSFSDNSSFFRDVLFNFVVFFYCQFHLATLYLLKKLI